MFDQIQTYPLETPALRPVELVPVKQGEQTLIMVRDPLGLIEGVALLPPDPMLLLFLEMADGKTSLGEMAQKLTMATGQITPEGLFESMAKQLDEALLLQTDRFVEALKAKQKEWQDSPTRPMKVFQMPEGDRLKIMKELGDEFRRHKMGHNSPPEQLDLPKESVIGILSPHIDYTRGGESYAWAYKALKECGTGAKKFIILATSHRPIEGYFAATRKDYATPFGTLKTDQTLLDEIAEAYDGDLFMDEYYHADEHTIELQAAYLKHVYGDDDISVVPILVSSIEDYLHEEGGTPSKDDVLTKFCQAIRTIIDKYGDEVAVIGGVDFSHCGPEFGHEELNEPEKEKEIEENDRAALRAIEGGDAESFFENFRPTKNHQNVCSIAPIYCMMKIFEEKGVAKLLNYQQANSPDKTGLVSFASMAFVKKGMENQKASKIILVSR